MRLPTIFKLLFSLLLIVFILPKYVVGIGFAYDELLKDGQSYLLAEDMMGDFGRKRFWTRPSMFPEMDKKSQVSCVDGLRDYACQWEINHDSLFLSKVTLLDKNMPEADLEKMFGSQCKGGKVFAYWVSGEFEGYDERLPNVDFLLREIHSGMFKIQAVWNVRDGKIIHWNRHEHSRNHISLLEWDEFAMAEYLAHEIDWKLFPSGDEFPVGISIQIKIVGDSLGRLVKVESECEESETNIEGFRKEVQRALEKIQDWTVIYDRGVFVPQPYQSRVHLNREMKPANP